MPPAQVFSGPLHGVVAAALAVLCMLIAASITWRVLAARSPSRDYTELHLRIRTWWILAALFFSALILGRRAAIVLFAFVSFLAFKEFLSLIPTRRTDHRVLFWAYLAIPIQYYWIATQWYVMFLVFIPVFAFLWLPMRAVIAGATDGFVRAVGTLHWGLMLTVFCFSHIAYMLNLDPARNPHGGGAGLVVYLVMLTQLNDVAQYIWGKSCGKHKVAPHVSPGKTVEGLVGGVATTVVLAVILAPLLTPMHGLYAAGAGLLIGLMGFFGDVTESAIKRDLGVKDSGNMLPGHGGVLDRIDSLMYTAPLFFHYIGYFYY